MITAAMVKELRDVTGAGMMECKKALQEVNGDKEKAINVLREKGLAKAAKRAHRAASQGLVESYIHLGGKVGVMVEVNCETDFVARNDEFKAFVRDICLHVAATNPAYLNKEDVPQDALEGEKEILRNQALREGKPEKIVDKIVQGRVEKFYQENCLMEQAFVKDPDITINGLLQQMIAKIGENMLIRRYVRFELGESLGDDEAEGEEE